MNRDLEIMLKNNTNKVKRYICKIQYKFDTKTMDHVKWLLTFEEYEDDNVITKLKYQKVITPMQEKQYKKYFHIEEHKENMQCNACDCTDSTKYLECELGPYQGMIGQFTKYRRWMGSVEQEETLPYYYKNDLKNPVNYEERVRQ